jgi:hypothetical protein
LDDIDRQAIEEFGYDEDEDDDDDEDFDEENDPLGLAAVDREIQRRGLVVQEDPDDFLPSANLTPDAFSSDFNPDEETFLRPIDILRQRNYSPLPMAELTDETVAPALWELLHELCRMNFFIVHTDHLSDAVLYHELTRTVLYQKVIIPELIETAACYHDCLHQREDEALQLWLKYYATGPQRLKWETQNTAEALPPSVEPPYQRDWHLPQLPVRP